MRRPHPAALVLVVCAGFAGAQSLPTRPSPPAEAWTDQYDHHFRKYSKRYFGPRMDWRWFKAQAIAESRLQKNARSRVGARGVMQIMPATYGDIVRQNPDFGPIHEPRWNIAAGIYYDHYLYQNWKEAHPDARFDFTFASYNAGLGKIKRAVTSAGKPPVWSRTAQFAPRETRRYLRRIHEVKSKHLSTPVREKKWKDREADGMT